VNPRTINIPRENIAECKRKGKIHPITGHEGPKGEKRYSSNTSLTSALEGVE